jgi:hypothetical protein
VLLTNPIGLDPLLTFYTERYKERQQALQAFKSADLVVAANIADYADYLEKILLQEFKAGCDEFAKHCYEEKKAAQGVSQVQDSTH